MAIIGTVDIEAYGKLYEGAEVHRTTYADKYKRTAIVIWHDGEPLCKLSINAPEYTVEEDEFIVKTYGENEPIWQQVEHLFDYEGKSVILGYASCPIWRVRKN